jgi:hypothetical protein
MKRFVRAVWKLLVGIKDALVLLLMLLFFGAALRGLSARPAPVGDGVLLPRPRRQRGRAAGAAEWSEPARRRAAWRANIACATSSPRSTPPRTTTGSRRSRSTSTASSAAARRDRDLGDALDARARGGQAGARLCHRLYRRQLPARRPCLRSLAEPAGRGAIAGPGGNNLYFKGLLDKLGVTANVYRVGTYKSAVEPFIRNDMSPEARENARRSARRCSRPGARRRRGAAQGGGLDRPVPARHAGRGRAPPAATWPRPRWPPAGRQDRRPPRLRSAAGRARRQGRRRPSAATAGSSSPIMSRPVDRKADAGRSAWSPSPA